MIAITGPVNVDTKLNPDTEYGFAPATEKRNDMIKLISARVGISREDAYTLCSLAADLRITQVVNGSKGVHVMLEKKYLVRA